MRAGSESGNGGARVVTAAWLIPSLGCMLLVGLLGITTKLALDDLEWPELVLWTSISYAVIAVAFVSIEGQRLQFVSDARWGVLSGMLAATALIMLFLALDNGDVSRVVPITASYPGVTLLLAAVVLREKVTGKRVIATALVIAGVILLSVE